VDWPQSLYEGALRSLAPDVAPVKVARFALDDRTPHADLYLSDGHALYLYGLLIPVGHLVNGRTIIAGQHTDALTLDYYHVELEATTSSSPRVPPPRPMAETLATASTTPRSMRGYMAQLSGLSGSSHPSSACSAAARS
jgi:hypothetical protein